MKFSKRFDTIEPYLFVGISKTIAEKKKQGIDVISFGIGDPDIPTPKFVLDSMFKHSNNPANHRYPESEGLPIYRESFSKYMKRRFNVELNPETEIISLIGAKEGIGHASLALIDEGDISLVPDPGYPVYSAGCNFSGGQIYKMPLKESLGWKPDLNDIPESVAKKSKILWINYPNNPTGGIADLGFFKDVVDFGIENDIAIMHDACYAEVTFDDYIAPSILEVDRAMEIAIEYHSFSKSFNMTGWRLGFAAGNKELVQNLLTVKSNLDSGVPQAIQMMGVEAFEKIEEFTNLNNEIYKKRRDKLASALSEIGLNVVVPKAALYLWCKVPEGYNSASFTELLLEQCNVVVTPGNGYGEYGEGYVRLSLTTPDDLVDEGVKRISKWKG
ncbi:MAG: LL-diaminopimelate aminotransferase [Chloroflexota bacterium]|nr:LL-diaminopimelate aminotransferase [Chloroflexota bacterium]